MIANRAPLRRFVRIRMKLYLGKEALAAITPPHRAAPEAAEARITTSGGSNADAADAGPQGSAPRIRGGKSAMMTAWQRRIIEGVSETADVQRVG